MSLSLMQITHEHEEIITTSKAARLFDVFQLSCGDEPTESGNGTVRCKARLDAPRRPAARPAFRRTIAIKRKAISMGCPETVLTWLQRLWESGARWHPAAPQ